MPTESVFDYEAVLTPIDGTDGGAGSDPRAAVGFDSPYEKFRGAYNQAREAERAADSARVRGEAPPAVPPKLWEAVVNQGTELLTRVGKDLEVAARLIEALARLYGAAGIRDGLTMTAQMADAYWDHLYPALDPVEGAEERTALLGGLNGANKPGVLVERINFVPVTEGSTERDFFLWEYSIATDAQRIGDEQARHERHQQLGYSLEDILKAAATTSGAFYLQLKEEIEGAETALQVFDQIFDRLCGQLAPPTSQIRAALDKARAAIQRLGQGKIDEMLALDEVVTPSLQASTSAQTAGMMPGTVPVNSATSQVSLTKATLNSRQDAILAMEMVAKYFRATEPHSPISYSLDKLVKWANMPLDKLILEWIPDSSARDLFGLMTGVVGRDDD